MKRSLFYFVMLTFMASSCKLPDIALSSKFKEQSTEYEIKGRNGWTKKKPMTFGPFTATSVKRGWTNTYNLPFLVQFKGSKHKTSFNLSDGKGRNATTFALGKIKLKEIEVLRGLMDLTLDYESYFAGSIVLSEEKTYNFMYPLPYEHPLFATEPGVLQVENDIYEIHKVNKWEGHRGSRFNDLNGYEIKKGNEVVAAVQKVNKNKIWISDVIDADDQFILANLCASLILMKDLEEAITDIENN